MLLKCYVRLPKHKLAVILGNLLENYCMSQLNGNVSKMLSRWSAKHNLAEILGSLLGKYCMPPLNGNAAKMIRSWSA